MATEFGQWLTVRFLEYQAAQQKRVTVAEFAQYLGGVHQVTVSRWMNGTRTPEQGYIPLLAKKFGDEIYDVLDLPRPDPRLQAIIANWKYLTDEQRERDEARVRRGMLLSAQREVERAETGQGRILEQVRHWRGLIGQADFEFKRDVLAALDVRVVLRSDEAGRRCVEVGTALSLPKPFEYMTARRYQRMLWGEKS